MTISADFIDKSVKFDRETSPIFLTLGVATRQQVWY
jgi:hypothetical protein